MQSIGVRTRRGLTEITREAPSFVRDSSVRVDLCAFSLLLLDNVSGKGDAAQVLDYVSEEVSRHRGEVEPGDDVTLMVAAYHGNPA